MREKEIEQKLVKEVKKLGGICWKFVSPGVVGVPDRIVLLYLKHIAFVEVKAPGKELRKVQVKRKSELESLGFKVYVLNDKEQIGGILNEIQTI